MGLLLSDTYALQNDRLVCRHWRQHITAQVEACPKGRLHELDLHPDPQQWWGRLAAVEACLPRTHSARVRRPLRLTVQEHHAQVQGAVHASSARLMLGFGEGTEGWSLGSVRPPPSP
jgi:hypothetical protein